MKRLWTLAAAVAISALAFTGTPASAHSNGHYGVRSVVPHAHIFVGGPRVGIDLSLGYPACGYYGCGGYYENSIPPGYCYDAYNNVVPCSPPPVFVAPVYPRVYPGWEYNYRYHYRYHRHW